MRLVCLLFLVLGLLLAPYAALADIYAFVDKNGVTHFSNAPVDPRYNLVLRTGAGRQAVYLGRYDHVIESAAERYRLSPSLLKAMIKVESNFNPRAVSRKGARGLMQLMPEVAREMRVASPYDPQANIHGGARYMRKLLDQFGNNLDLALAAYNAGPTRVKKAGGIPRIKETKNYVRLVRQRYKQYLAVRP